MIRPIVMLLAIFSLVLPLVPRDAGAQEEPFLTIGQDAALGALLADAEGRVLYLFTPDTTPGESACDDQCAENWPPLVPADAMALPAGVPGELGTIERTDGAQQVTYNDIPLYYFIKDEAPGDANGQGAGGVWFVVHPGSELGPYAPAPGEGTPVPASAVKVGFAEDLGPFLIDAEGKTIYLFTKDTTAGESACDGECAENWPPVPAADAMLLPPGIPGMLGAIDRADGSSQLTYNDIPLYYYAEDEKAGDTNGQGAGDVWFVVAPGMKLGDAPGAGAVEATPAA